MAMALRYGVVGGFCTVLNIGIVWLGTERAHLAYPIAAISTCFITIPISYLLHRGITFAAIGPRRWAEWWRFVAAQLSQFALGLLLMSVVVETLGWRPWIAMGVVSAIMFVYGFLASSTWVFRAWHPAARAKDGASPAAGPLRILQVCAYFPNHVGGIEAVAAQLAFGLAGRGVDVVWMAGGEPYRLPAGDLPGLTIDQAASVDFIEPRLGLPAPVWSLSSLRRLWRHVGEADVVQVHDYLYFGSLAALWFAHARRRPVVLTQHIGDIAFRSRTARGLLRAFNRTLGRVALRSATQAVFVGLPVMRQFDDLVRYRTPPLLISNGVDHALYRPDNAARPASEGAPLRALFVGRFVEKKGLALLRDCMAVPGVHWTFVGSGPASPAHWRMPADVVSLPGVLSPPEVAAEMRRADVLVLPSTGEGFPLVIQEALASGTPVLTSGEVADAFPQTDPACVWRVDLAGTHDEGVARLRAALADLAGARERLVAARAHAATLAAQWSWDRCVADYAAIYDRVRIPLERRAARSA